MVSDSDEIVDQVGRLREDFRALTEMVTGPDAFHTTAAEMELRIFRELLALGRGLLAAFFALRAAKRPVRPPSAPDGTPLTQCHQRNRTYLSVFGKICFQRHRFQAPGQAGVSPLDAELSLPARCYSPLLGDGLEHEIAEAAYAPSAKTLQRILDIDLSKNALETLVAEDAVDVEAFYDQKPLPAPADEGVILVVQADGAGVRMVGSEPSERTGHRTSKREAVATTLYTIARHVRSPLDVAIALLEEPEAQPGPRPVRPAPVGKESWATLAGKDVAFQRLSARVARRDGRHIQDRVALSDGDEALRPEGTRSACRPTFPASPWCWTSATPWTTSGRRPRPSTPARCPTSAAAMSTSSWKPCWTAVPRPSSMT
jgi:hypothetical protein